jgi:enoyl-CoA hydratase/carnithine racemase
MDCIRLEREGNVLVVHLARGRANALNASMVDQLHEAVDQAESNLSVRAVVVASDSPRLFCGGFDITEVFAYDRALMIGFFDRFSQLFERLRTLPKPVVAAISGHAFAGGAILALAADVRVMSDTASLAVNEVDLGVVLPTHMLRALAATGHGNLMRAMLLGGEVITAERALAGGVVVETAPAIDVLPVSITRARNLGDKPLQAFGAHKLALDVVGPRPPAEVWRREVEHVVDVWFGEEATARRRALVDKLARKG